MAHRGDIQTDPEFQWLVIQLYWQVSTAIADAQPDLSPDDRLTLAAVELGALDPRRDAPFSIAEISALMGEPDRTVRDRIERLERDQVLTRTRGRIELKSLEARPAFYALLARLLADRVEPIAYKAYPSPSDATEHMSTIPQPGEGNVIDGILVDRTLMYEIASLFFIQAKYMERRSGLDATDRMITLTVASRRLDPSLKGADGPSTRSIHRSTGIAKSTTDDRVRNLVDRRVLMRRDGGLDVDASAVLKLYQAILELFVRRALPVLTVIGKRKRK